MYQVLLLNEMSNNNHRVKEYLSLGGYAIKEQELYEEDVLKDLHCFDLILIESDEVEQCIEVVRRVRCKVQIPIIVLSDRDDEWEKICLFRNGIDDYLVKPYWQGEFLARIHAHIERYKRLTRPFGMIKVDGLEINAFSRRVLLNGKEVELRLKEFDVLLYLAQHMDRAVTKKEIYEEIWKDDLADGFYNTVAVHVKRIRAKIERDVENPRYIQTVWGIGYQFRS